MNPNLSQDNLNDLNTLRCEGKVAYLPEQQLRDYASLKKLFQNATGKYSKGKFTFDFPADAIIAGLISGEFTNLKKELQFFPTPREMANFAIDQLTWDFDINTARFLEPSAGQGAIANALIRKFGPTINVDLVEISAFNCAILRRQFPSGNFNITHGDFLQMEGIEGGYDVIVANPPFTRLSDIDHVMHMYSMLKPGGQLISIMSTSWLHNTQKKAAAFRAFMEENGDYRTNGQGTFKTSGTMIDSTLVELRK